MNDPYAVLGVSSSASEEEIKRAYRDLVKKYHPDNYANNPLADLAEAKMKEVNEAYDAIMKARTQGGYQSAGGNGYGGGRTSSQGGGRYNNPTLIQVRQLIAQNGFSGVPRPTTVSGTTLWAVSPTAGAGWTMPARISGPPATWTPTTWSTVRP